MSRKKPTGQQKGSVQKKVHWKALEIVHPDAAGIDVGGSEHWVAISPDRDPSRCGLSDRLPQIRGRWTAGWWKRRAQRGHAVDWRVLRASL
jgi:hypothetical protein